MGTHKQKSLEQKTKKGLNSVERKMQRLLGFVEAVEKNLPALSNALHDYENPLIELRIYLREGGDYLGIVKREVGVKDEILFSGADDIIECFDNLNNAIASGKWKADRPRGNS